MDSLREEIKFEERNLQTWELGPIIRASCLCAWDLHLGPAEIGDEHSCKLRVASCELQVATEFALSAGCIRAASVQNRP